MQTHNSLNDVLSQGWFPTRDVVNHGPFSRM